LSEIFKVCDEVCKQHGLTKIKTIGDSYMAVAGVPEPLNDHATQAARAAISMVRGLKSAGKPAVRVGLHCGPLVAGIVGEERLQYDVWGDTVNVASRMESTGEPGRIHVSQAFAQALSGREGDGLRERGTLVVKGKGQMKTYWLEGA